MFLHGNFGSHSDFVSTAKSLSGILFRQQKSWRKQLGCVIEYIGDNLTGEISHEEASKIACCSTYYFQRMFSYVAGVSL